MRPLPCPRCGSRKSWRLRDGRRRCAICRFDWRPGRLPLRLSRAEWRAIVTWFVRGAPSARIAHETRLERKRVLRALTIARQAMRRSIVDRAGERSMFAADAASEAPRPPRLAVLGIYSAHGHVGVDVIDNRDVEHFGRALRTRAGERRAVPPGLDHYLAVVYRGRLYRLPDPQAGRAPFGQIEAFWAYLQRHLRTKGGIRAGRLSLYLAEFAWRYEHRKLPAATQVNALMRMIREPLKGQEWDFPRRSASRRASAFFPPPSPARPAKSQ